MESKYKRAVEPKVDDLAPAQISELAADFRRYAAESHGHEAAQISRAEWLRLYGAGEFAAADAATARFRHSSEQTCNAVDLILGIAPKSAADLDAQLEAMLWSLGIRYPALEGPYEDDLDWGPECVKKFREHFSRFMLTRGGRFASGNSQEAYC